MSSPALTLLTAHGIKAKEISEQKRALTANVCKTVAFQRKDAWPVAVLIQSHRRVSYAKLKKWAGQDVKPLSPQELQKLGFTPGECAPMLMPCELLVDKRVPTLKTIVTGSGTLGTLVESQFADLARVKGYVVLDLAEPLRESSTKEH